jgi:HAD superfamily hydrolase (TIGR01490 family)
MARIAFFDVDKTVLSVNSASLWIRREVRLGHIGVRQALGGFFWAALYALGMARMEGAIVSAAATMRGQRERDLDQRAVDFWRDDIRRFVRPAARAAVEAHRARGDRVFLLTSTSVYLSRQIAADLGCDGYLCNRMEVEDGLFTGRIERPLCFGPGKLELAARLAAEHGVPLADCTYYGDSYSDLPVLLAVGDPVVVNPDLRLRREARLRGFRVEDWEAGRARSATVGA